MKEQVFIQTANVKRAMAEIKRLLNRPRHDMVGLGMIYGEPGLGKSRLAKYVSYRKGFIYIRLEASDTAKSFAQKLWVGLKYQLHLTEQAAEDISAPAGSTNSLIGQCIRILMDSPDSVIMIDEFDNAMPNRELRESVRDIVDQTFATVILVGMHGVREKLERTNKHFFDRSNFFCEFHPLDLEDVQKVCAGVCEFEMTPKMVETAYVASKGQFRALIKTIMKFEEKISTQKPVTLSRQDLEEINNASLQRPGK
jgi:DNA transposition AAA+ family ATPase